VTTRIVHCKTNFAQTKETEMGLHHTHRIFLIRIIRLSRVSIIAKRFEWKKIQIFGSQKPSFFLLQRKTVL